MLKNVATKLVVYCWDATTGLPKTGDAANLTAYVSLDWDTSPDAIADTSATELSSTNAKGFYIFDLAQGETNGDYNLYTCKSSTSNIVCVCVPAFVHTLPTAGVVGVGGNVKLADSVTHGGSAAVLQVERIIAASTTSNEPAMKLTGNGSAPGLDVTGGSGGPGTRLTSGGGDQHGLEVAGNGTAAGFSATGGADGHGIYAKGGSTTGDGIRAVAITSGQGVNIIGVGTSKHGMLITGGTGGTSDGLKLVAGTGGVGFRLDTLTASGAVALGSTLTVTGATTLTGAVTASNASNNIVGIDVAKAAGVAWASGAIVRAVFAADTGLQTIRSNTAQSGASGSITLDASASASDDFYNDTLVIITGGTGVGQSRTIGDYTGSSKIATVSPNWVTNPDNTSTFAIRQAGTIAGATAPTAAQIRAEMDSNSTQFAAIVADTNELQTDWTNGGRLDLLIDAIKAKTDNLPSDPADASDIAGAFSTVNSTLATIAGYIDTEVAAIKAKTDNLPAAPAATGDCITSAGVRTAVGLASANLDTQLAAIQADSPNTPTKNVAYSNFLFMMVDETDFNTPEPSITVTAQISKDGGAFANCANSVSEISGGWYKINLSQAEMNCDSVALKFTGTGCAQRNYSFRTQPT